MTQTQETKLLSPSPEGESSTTDTLDRWLQLLRQRLSNSAARMLSRFLMVFGFLGSAYILGWGEIPIYPTLSHYLALLVFPLFALGLYWFSRQLDDSTVDWDRWWSLLPLGFFLAALRHLTHSWLIALSVWAVSALASLLFHFLRRRQYKLGERLKQTGWDNLFLLLCLTNLFIPRALFASLAVFLPLVLLVVFYNFILERDRLQRAKALAIGPPAPWLRRANRLLPSSTYLFLLLPGLLVAEAFLFHASYQKTHSAFTAKSDPYVAPTLRNWLSFTVSVRMRARFKTSLKKDSKEREIIYRELGRGYSLTASLIRGFLVFFYAKRLLLIFLLLMEATLGIRVHRIGEIEGVAGAGARLKEQRQVLLRTLDSFPRAWSGFILRGIQGKHGFLDPLGGLIYGMKWLRSQLLPRLIPGMEPTEQPSEPPWSRLVREEQISLLGEMQDRAWVLEAFVDLVSPAHSSTIRGKLYYHGNIPILRDIARFYFHPPETEIRARIINEMATLIGRAIESGQATVLLSDTETESLTSEQVWTLRDRALLVLGDLVQSKEQPIRLAASQAIAKIATFTRPVAYYNPEIWERVSLQLGAQLSSTSTQPKTDASLDSTQPKADTSQDFPQPKADATLETTPSSPQAIEQREPSDSASIEAPLQSSKQAALSLNKGSPQARNKEAPVEAVPSKLSAGGSKEKGHEGTQESIPVMQETIQELDKMEFPDPFQKWLEVERVDETHALIQALGTIGVKQSVEELQSKASENKDWLTVIQECFGLGTRASGHPQAGFALIQEHLLRYCQDQSLSQQQRCTALGALVRIAYPYPIAQSYVQLKKNQKQHRHRYRELEEKHATLERLEASYQTAASEKTQEELWQTYHLYNQLFSTYEQESRILLQDLQDTFWTTLHYSAVILISAYIKGEGFAHTPDFTDLLGKLSLEDPQGWSEFLSNLPPLQETTNNYTAYDTFLRWVADIQQGTPSQQGMFQRFLELKGAISHIEMDSTAAQPWRKSHHFIERYTGFLHECLLEWTPCLQHRPTLYVHFLDREEAESKAWWQLTLTGSIPWLQQLSEAPHHVSPEHMYLAYEQFTPLQLSPLTQLSWHSQPTPEALVHGHLPGLSYWSYNFHRSPQMHLRQIDANQKRGYWRSPEKLNDDSPWKQSLQMLASLQEFRPLTDLDFQYLKERSQACFQRVLSRSRLREQDALMIVRDSARKLNHFLHNSHHEEKRNPTVFLLTGDAGVGLSTMLLQHARQQLTTLSSPTANNTDQASESPSETRVVHGSSPTANEAGQASTLVYFLDIGLLKSTDNLATWLYKELQLQVEDEVRSKLQEEPLEGLSTLFATLHTILPQKAQVVLYLDGFHENPAQGIPLLAEALQWAEQSHESYPWLFMILAIRRSFLETNLTHPSLRSFVSDESFHPPEGICYRERGSVYGAVMELTPFKQEAPQDARDSRSELERAYERYYSFTDTSGSPRYRPLLRQVNELETFGLTRSLLSHPALLPVVMETYHQRELPNDLHLIELLHEYTQQYSLPEQEFLQHLTRRMLFGKQTSKIQTHDPGTWLSDPLLSEKELLEDRELSEYIETFKYGYSLYESLRSRGLLIRRWRTPRHSEMGTSQNDNTEMLLPERHVTFTSYQLQEYLLFRELQRIAPDWSHYQERENPEFANAPPTEADWLLQLTTCSLTFRPMEGAMILLLLDLIEHKHYSVVADFNDYSQQQGINSHHLLFGALQHLSPQAVTHVDGPVPIILKDLSENDLRLIAQLGQHWKRRGLYQEVDILYSLVLEHPKISAQLHRFPKHLTELLLERADNQRRILAQRSGDELTQASYREGRTYYEHALERIKQQHPSPLTQAKVLRFLALYEIDTNHLEDATQSLQQAWELSQTNTETSVSSLEQAWIRHLQSALTRRQLEVTDVSPLQEAQRERLEQAHKLGQEALELVLQSHENGRTELLAQIYDNLARTLLHLAQEESSKEQQLKRLQEAMDSFDGSLQAKHSLNDVLGLAISYSGLGESYQKRAELQVDADGAPHAKDWNTAKSYFEQGLAINQNQLQSDFGIALSHQALASLYLLHPGHHTDGISELLEAMLSFSKINNRHGSLQILKKLVGEIASLPVHELYRLVKHIVSEIQLLHQQSEWLLEAFWKELQSVLGESIPRMLRDFFSPFFSSKDDSQPKT